MLKIIDNQPSITAVTTALFELGIFESASEVLDLDQDLRDGLGLDSQEMVSLVEIVSSLVSSAAPLDDNDVVTVRDLVDYLTESRDAWLPQDTPYVLQGSTIINQDIDTVFDYIAKYKDWPDVLAHVALIEPEYDDGRLQTFKMHIEELGTKEPYFVQSWRYVNEELKIVDFTQPKPPVGFRVHKGGWRFVSKGAGKTELVSYHGFDLEDGKDPEQAIVLIRKHIQAALRTWAKFGNSAENA
ncbi:MAG: SRPBCC family protein [Paracoccaceae bacterium]